MKYIVYQYKLLIDSNYKLPNLATDIMNETNYSKLGINEIKILYFNSTTDLVNNVLKNTNIFNVGYGHKIFYKFKQYKNKSNYIRYDIFRNVIHKNQCYFYDIYESNGRNFNIRSINLKDFKNNKNNYMKFNLVKENSLYRYDPVPFTGKKNHMGCNKKIKNLLKNKDIIKQENKYIKDNYSISLNNNKNIVDNEIIQKEKYWDDFPRSRKGSSWKDKKIKKQYLKNKKEN